MHQSSVEATEQRGVDAGTRGVGTMAEARDQYADDKRRALSIERYNLGSTHTIALGYSTRSIIWKMSPKGWSRSVMRSGATIRLNQYR